MRLNLSRFEEMPRFLEEVKSGKKLDKTMILSADSISYKGKIRRH